MTKRILMCPADFFGIEYEINAWMHEDNQVNHDLAVEQWRKLHDIYTSQLNWEVELDHRSNTCPIWSLPPIVA